MLPNDHPVKSSKIQEPSTRERPSFKFQAATGDARRLVIFRLPNGRAPFFVLIRPGENEVRVQFKSREGLKTVHTKWLVGCDGMHSLVREQAPIPFIGGDYEESFVLADVEMDWPLG